MSDNPARTVTAPRSAEQISKLLVTLALPVPDRIGYVALSQTEGTRFADAVGQAAAGNGSVQLMEYLRATLAAVAPSTRELLADMGFKQVDLCTLIQIATREGRSFASAVEAAARNPDDSSPDSAANYLSNLIDEYGPSGGIGVCIDLDRLPTAAPPSGGESHVHPVGKVADVGHVEPTTSHAHRKEGGPSAAVAAAGIAPPKEYGQTHRVYGQSAAVCFAETEIRNSSKQTVMVEMAAAEAGGVNWQGKSMVMLSLADLPMVLGLFLGCLRRVEMKARGRQNEKYLTMERQGKQFYMSMAVRGRPKLGVPIPAAEAYQIVAMLTRQMGRNDPHIPYEGILALSRHVCSLLQEELKESSGE